MSFWLTFFSGSIAGAVVVWLAIKFFEHRLAKELSASDRRANAAIEFRAKINEAMSKFPAKDETWRLHSQTHNAINNFIPIAELAVKNYAGFLGRVNESRITSKWKETKDYCQTTLPRSLKGNGDITADQARDDFLQHVKVLLSYAKET